MALHGAGYDPNMVTTEAPTDKLSPTTMVFNYLKAKGVPLTAGNISQALRDHAGDPAAFANVPANEGQSGEFDQAGMEPDAAAQPQRRGAATLPIPPQPGDPTGGSGEWDKSGGNTSAPPTQPASGSGLDWLRPLVESGSLGAAILGKYMAGRGGAPMPDAMRPPDGAGVPAQLGGQPELTPPPAAAPIPIQAMPVEPAVPAQAALPAPTTGPGSGQLLLPAPTPQQTLPANLQPAASGPAKPALDTAVGGAGDIPTQVVRPSRVRVPKVRVPKVIP